MNCGAFDCRGNSIEAIPQSSFLLDVAGRFHLPQFFFMGANYGKVKPGVVGYAALFLSFGTLKAIAHVNSGDTTYFKLAPGGGGNVLF